MKLKSQIMDEMGIKRALKRISHEITEKNKGTEDLILVGIRRRGVPIASRIAGNIHETEGTEIPVREVDITHYRDDLTEFSDFPEALGNTEKFEVTGKKIILIDDVLYTGRTVRAAIEAVIKMGRPKSIQLAVLVDRGHRELPIRADYVGKNIPTSGEEIIGVELRETDSCDSVGLYEK